MISDITKKLDLMIPNPVCELNYTKDYELLIATVLSAQSTDKRVNIVTEKLFEYNIHELSLLDNKKLEDIIKTNGTYTKKAKFIKAITSSLIINNNGIVPNDRKYLESLPGVGRKTTNVVLSNLFNEPSIAVDTHVLRVSNRLKLVNTQDVLKVERKLMKMLPKENWNRVNDQLVLFGRYICKAVKPECDKCEFNKTCEYKKKKSN